MNQKRQYRQVPQSEDQVVKKICTTDLKIQDKKENQQQQQSILTNEQIKQQIKSLKIPLKFEDIEPSQTYYTNKNIIIYPFQAKLEGQSNQKSMQCVLYNIESPQLKAYIQSFNSLYQSLKPQFLNDELTSYVLFNDGLVYQNITIFEEQYACLLKFADKNSAFNAEQSAKQWTKFIKLNHNEYYPGLSQRFQDSLQTEVHFDFTKIDLKFLDEELKLLDPISDKILHHEKKQEKFEVRQMVEYFALQFQEFIQPNLHAFETALTVQKLNASHQISLENVSYGFRIENLVTAIANIYIDSSIEYSEKQNSINNLVKTFNSEVSLTLEEISSIFYITTYKLVKEIMFNGQYKEQSARIIQKLIRINPIYFENQIRLACGKEALYKDNEEPDYSEFINDRKTVCLKNMPIFFTKSHPVKIVRGCFQYLFDDHGRTFTDCANNVQHVGHNHPRVAKAGKEQIIKFNSNTRFLNPNIIDYAKNLIKSAFPPELNVCMFCNSGSEANDMALNIARTLANSQEIIIMDHSYHGTTTAVEQISETKFNSQGGHGQQDFIHIVDMPDQYRGRFSYDDPESGEKYALQVKEKIDEIKKQGKIPAAYICESMPAVGGMTTLPKNYLKNVYKYIREAGGICIADEVQVGFGRVADYWWAYELQDVVPDIVVIGKPMGNGHPVAGLVMTQEVADKFNNGQPYFNTYGGNPVSMKIANEVINVIQEENMRENAGVVGEYLYKELNVLKQKYEIVGDIRGYGLFIGIELVKCKKSMEAASEEAENISNALKNKGFIMLHEGYLKNVLKIKPALTFSIQNSREFVKTFEEIIASKQY